MSSACNTALLHGSSYARQLLEQLVRNEASRAAYIVAYDENACAKRPISRSSTGCPRGLACTEGACEPCERTCTSSGENYDDCRSAGAGADGEVCAGDTCIPAANAVCQSYRDCPENQTCLVGGLSGTARGNEASLLSAGNAL